MYCIGYDVGSSFVKASIVCVESGAVVAQASCPETEMPILAPARGWAEQDAETWWEAVRQATILAASRSPVRLSEIQAIGIAYQMHGLVLVDRAGVPLRPAIIWCDSRATEIGRKAFSEMGESVCQQRLLNSPGNFTASKLRWVKENEPAVYEKAFKALLPGDYIALRLTGEFCTTISGLSEGILWDFRNHTLAKPVLDYYQLRDDLIAEIVPAFAPQGHLTIRAAQELELMPGIPVSYRAGDQPNNAFSLKVLEPGEVASTGGTSGVVYAVSGDLSCDPQSRINAFAHVNHCPETPRIGILLCINGAGSANRWIRRLVAGSSLTYDAMNQLASAAPIGSKGIVVLPFGNGAERMLCDKDVGAHVFHLNFNVHLEPEIFRAVQEGVAFGFNYGLGIMDSLGAKPRVLRAGVANLFLSPIFCTTLASTAGVCIELYNTDGAQGAARAAAVGAGLVSSVGDALKGVELIRTIEPESSRSEYIEAYRRWLECLNSVTG